MLRRHVAFLALFACLQIHLLAGESAGTVQSRIIDGINTVESTWPTVGKVEVAGGFGTGTLIAPRFVLTAAHVVTYEGYPDAYPASLITFSLGGVVYAVRRVTVHPTWNWNFETEGEFDLAILELQIPVPDVTPSLLNRTPPTIGTSLVLVGYGTLGTGAGGEDGTLPPAGTVQYGYTPLDGLTPTYLTWDFEQAIPLESDTAHGDSGGPAFIDHSGIFFLAAVTSGGWKPDCSWGDHSFDTRVDTAVDWIDSIADTGSGTGGDSDTPKPDLVIGALTPIPASAYPIAGQTFNFAATVSNRGDADAGAFTVCVYLDSANQPSSSGSAVATAFVTHLGVGETVDVTFGGAGVSNADVMYPSGGTGVIYPEGGSYTLAVKVDADNAVAESDEMNNTFFYPVDVASQHADLAIKYVSVVDDATGVHFTLTIANTGMEDIGDLSSPGTPAFSVGFWKNRLSAPTTANAPEQSYPISFLAKRTMREIHFNLPPQSGAGSAWFFVDNTNNVAEANENNNSTFCGWGVANGVPSVNSGIGASATAVATGTAVNFSVVASDADGDSLTYLWDFGDGATEEIGAPSASHSYTAPGTYTVSVTVSDGPFHTIVKTMQLTVANDNYIDLGTVSLSKRRGQANFTLQLPADLNKKKDKLRSSMVASSTGAFVKYNNLRARVKGQVKGVYTFTVEYTSRTRNLSERQKYRYTVVD